MGAIMRRPPSNVKVLKNLVEMPFSRKEAELLQNKLSCSGPS